MAREVALHHHEKWDGSGYPADLQGEDISLAGRIVALADIYDALRNKRSYKPALCFVLTPQAEQQVTGTAILGIDTTVYSVYTVYM